jgi:YVTN family beta-propeller protein
MISVAALALLALGSSAAPVPAQLETVDDRTTIDPATRERFELRRSPPAPAAGAGAGAEGAAVLAPSASSDPRTLTSLADGYVACFSTNDAYPFDLASLAVAPALDLSPEGTFPYDAAINPSETEVWHLGASGDHVLVIDRATRAITRRILVGQYPVGIAFSWDGALAFVSSRDDLRMDVIDTATYQVIRSLAMPATPSSQEPGKLVVDPVSHLLYMAEWYGPRVYEIAADGSAILRSAVLGDSHWGISVSADGQHLFVAERDPALNLVRDIDRAALTEVRTIGVCLDPWGLDLTADGSKLVVACEDGDMVQVIDVVSWTAAGIPLPTSDGPQDLDILDASGLAFVAAGREGATAVVYVIDIATASIAASFPVAGYKTSVMAVQGRATPPNCPAPVPEVGRLDAVKRMPAVRVSWSSLAEARNGYNLWRVADKTELPIVTNPPAATVYRVCARSPLLFCEDPGAAGPGGTTHYYAVKGVCGLNEGP